jgi:hypothetical protein
MFGGQWGETDCSADRRGCTTQTTPAARIHEWGCAVALSVPPPFLLSGHAASLTPY